MKRFVFFLLSFVFTTTAVASAEVVQAPIVPRGTFHSEPRLGMKPPAEFFQINTIEQIGLALRQSAVTSNADSACGEWAGLAFDVGWSADDIPELLRIMNRESRCLPDACSQSDSGRVCRDWGLMQINEYSWRTTIINQGYQMSDMWNPELNLRFALWLYLYSKDKNGDGWQPWDMSHAT